MPARSLTALPVYNEVKHVEHVLAEVRRYAPNVLVVDDGSTDGTGELLKTIPGIQVVPHERNRGYGAALHTAFAYAQQQGYDVLVTIDCDGQHQPRQIPRFVEACDGWDVVSGSRYLERFPGDSEPPADRRHINEQLTAEINRRLSLNLTDSFCGFKAYRVSALAGLELQEAGYAMPLEFWVVAARAGLKIRELAVPLIYLEEFRSFGGSLDNAATRLKYYYQVLDRVQASVAASAASSTRGGSDS